MYERAFDAGLNFRQSVLSDSTAVGGVQSVR